LRKRKFTLDAIDNEIARRERQQATTQGQVGRFVRVTRTRLWYDYATVNRKGCLWANPPEFVRKQVWYVFEDYRHTWKSEDKPEHYTFEAEDDYLMWEGIATRRKRLVESFAWLP